MFIPFDTTKNIHLEYEGYSGTPIKQADVVLIGFPLMWPLDEQVRKNDLLYYEQRTRSNGPAMTWGMHAIGFIDLGDYEQAAQMLNRSYTLYVKKPFYTWTEAYQEVGAVNFITGAGGFLQTFLFGYGGLRLHAEEIRFNTSLPLPPDTTRFSLNNIKYLGWSLNFHYTQNNITIFVNGTNNEQRLEIASPNGQVYDLLDYYNRRAALLIPKWTGHEYIIRSKTSTQCPLPYDKIDLKQCDSDPTNTASSLSSINILILSFVLILAIIF